MEYNFTFSNNLTTPVIETTSKGLSTEGQIILLFFAIITIAYIYFGSNKEKWEHWKNPKGHEVNVVKISRILLWGYTGFVIIAFLVQKFILGG